MKRIFTITIIMCCFLLAACDNAHIGVVGGADGPTAILVTENGGKVKERFAEQYEKNSVRMFNVDGELYYDSGLSPDRTPRCGTMDGELKKTVGEDEIPHKSGESNFDAEGFQHATSITKEVNVDGKWVIFKKYNNIPENLTDYKYCFYIKGRLNNAAVDSEIVVLTDSRSVTLNDVYAPMLSSVKANSEADARISYNRIRTSDKWGITLYSEDVTKTGMTIKIEQFGGSPTGELQTGAAYRLETTVEDEWQNVKAKFDNPVWNSLAYEIKKNDITKLEVNWKYLYGELSPGFYRLSKEIMDFREAGGYGEELYEVYFTVE
ncbi:MAG: hypothetical protein IKW64_02705 [Clostridia bacterium]|nr:hypothetical protein [Clostridia bacterium]